MKYYKLHQSFVLSKKEAKAILSALEDLPMMVIAQNTDLVKATMKIKDHLSQNAAKNVAKPDE